MICFQNVSLIYWYSTLYQYLRLLTTLWFAFKMYLWFIDIQQCDWWSSVSVLWFAFKMYLWFIDIQQFLICKLPSGSCDLLSKCIFDLLIFNLWEIHGLVWRVVICFQNVSLIYWYSTGPMCWTMLPALWFAFKMYLWFIDIQPARLREKISASCDLLSKCIFDLLIFNRCIF